MNEKFQRKFSEISVKFQTLEVISALYPPWYSLSPFFVKISYVSRSHLQRDDPNFPGNFPPLWLWEAVRRRDCHRSPSYWSGRSVTLSLPPYHYGLAGVWELEARVQPPVRWGMTIYPTTFQRNFAEILNHCGEILFEKKSRKGGWIIIKWSKNSGIFSENSEKWCILTRLRRDICLSFLSFSSCNSCIFCINFLFSSSNSFNCTDHQKIPRKFWRENVLNNFVQNFEYRWFEMKLMIEF